MLVECRVMLSQETIDEIHRMGGSLQYAIEDGLRIWLYAAHRKQHERSRRSLAAKKAALTRQQRRLARHIPTRDDEGKDIVKGHPYRDDMPLVMHQNWPGRLSEAERSFEVASYNKANAWRLKSPR